MRKLLGAMSGLLSLGSATFFTMFAIDLVTGGNPETGAGVLAGLVVFFAGLTVSSGFAAYRMLATKGAAARARADVSLEPSVPADIAIEQRLLALAAQAKGRVTIAEVALSCAVSLEVAEQALDALVQRGHANMNITDEGDRVYVIAGFLSEQEKEQARDVVEVARG